MLLEELKAQVHEHRRAFSDGAAPCPEGEVAAHSGPWVNLRSQVASFMA